MSEVKLSINAHIYGKLDRTSLLSSSSKEQGFRLSNADVDLFVGYLEWFEPEKREIKKIREDLENRKNPIYQVIVNIVDGIYGNDVRAKQGADFFGHHYKNSADVNNFFMNLGKVVRRHGVQKTLTRDKMEVSR